MPKSDFPHPSIQVQLPQLEACIAHHVNSETALIREIANYLIISGGKRLRPLLALHCAALLGSIHDRQIHFATIIELLHNATLLHDDIVDDSRLRRGKLTANCRWNNASSILSGDFLYAQALQMAVSIGDLRLLTWLTDAVKKIAEGEVEQLGGKAQLHLQPVQCLQIMQRKTATLFAVACAGGAHLSGASDTQLAACHDFGLCFGVAFQVVDDFLDYRGSASTIGKQTGDDLREGKVTLPLLYAWQRASDSGRALISQALRSPFEQKTFDHIIHLMEESHAFDHTVRQAEQYLDRARQALCLLPHNAIRTALMALTEELLPCNQ